MKGGTSMVATWAAARCCVAVPFIGAAGFVLAACGQAAPPPVTYVLGAPAAGTEQIEPLLGRPVIEVNPVRVPDYLDSSELLVRRERNVVAPSPTGRWGERLSVGVTRALAGGLTDRLPDRVVTTTSADRSACRVLVDVQTFEQYAGAPVQLLARWRVLDGASGAMLSGERVSLAEPVTGAGDAEIVAAMSRAVEGLAERVAAGIRRIPRGCSASSTTQRRAEKS